MESSRDMSSNDTEVAEEVASDLGGPSGVDDVVDETPDSTGHDSSGDSLRVQKRLKSLKRSHDREMREMQARMAEMQSQIPPNNHQSFDANPYAAPGQGSGIEETISKAVSFALAQKDQEERKAKAAEAGVSLSKEYHSLQHHLDSLADKYDDFDEVVRSDHVPITDTMRDAALMLPKKGAGSAGEVLYTLGKNPENLSRISKLYPHQQAAELVALSHALASGGEQKGHSPRSLGQVKANPVINSAGITEKTSPSAIRALMKAGKFK